MRANFEDISLSPFFPELLQDIIQREGIPLIEVAKLTGKSVHQITAWIVARQLPDIRSIVELSQLFANYRKEILHSALLCEHLAKQRTGDFILRSALEKIIHTTEGTCADLSDRHLSHLIEIWKESTNLKHVETNLIVPPQPPLVLSDQWDRIINAIVRNNDTLYALDWKRFEDFIAYMLEQFGWQTKPMGYTKDNAVDIIAVRSVAPNIGFRMLVQCKKRSKHRKVGIDIIREIWAVKSDLAFHQAMVVTTSLFTAGAIQRAKAWNMELSDHYSIVEWCRQYGSITRA